MIRDVLSYLLLSYKNREGNLMMIVFFLRLQYMKSKDVIFLLFYSLSFFMMVKRNTMIYWVVIANKPLARICFLQQAPE